jgi:hypothetical protein
LLNLLTGRETLAAAALAKPANGNSPEAVWRRALDLHLRQDWRPYDQSPPESLIERLAL